MTTPQPPPGYEPVTTGVTQEGDLWSAGEDWHALSDGDIGEDVSSFAAVARPIRRKVHNPASLTPEQVGVSEGYRLLDEDEVIVHAGPLTSEIESWSEKNSAWRDGLRRLGSNKENTYRTRLSRAELRAARGLPEPDRSAVPGETLSEAVERLKTECAQVRQERTISELRTQRDDYWQQLQDSEREIESLTRRLRESDERNAGSLRDNEELSRKLNIEQAAVEYRDNVTAEFIERCHAASCQEDSLAGCIGELIDGNNHLAEESGRLQAERDRLAAEVARQETRYQGALDIIQELARDIDRLKRDLALSRQAASAAIHDAGVLQKLVDSLIAEKDRLTRERDEARNEVGRMDMLLAEERDEQKARANNAVDVMEVAIKKAQEAEARETTLREALVKLTALYESPFDGEMAPIRPDWLVKALAGTEERQPAPSANLDGFNTPY